MGANDLAGQPIAIWVCLVLAIALGEALGMQLAGLLHSATKAVKRYWRRLMLRRRLPSIERKAYTERELDRERFAKNLREDPNLSAQAIEDALKQFDMVSNHNLQVGMNQLRREAGVDGPTEGGAR